MMLFGVPVFAEGDKTDPAAVFINDVMNSIPDKLMQAQIDQTLKPVLN